MAKQPISYFIHLSCFCDAENVQLDNNETNEKFIIKQINTNEQLISRYLNGSSEEWIEEMEQYTESYEYRKIVIHL